MKIFTYLKTILPSAAVFSALFALPIALIIYFVVSQYSDRFILEQNITYFDVQNNWLGQAFIDQKWLEWFNRFMDFAFWGVAALVILLLVWAISSAKIAFKNHYAQENFTNFSVNKSSWHGHFFTVFVLKAILIAIIVYAVLAVVGKQIPVLSIQVSVALFDTTWTSIYPAMLTGFVLVGYQLLIVICIKLFKHLRAN